MIIKIASISQLSYFWSLLPIIFIIGNHSKFKQNLLLGFLSLLLVSWGDLVPHGVRVYGTSRVRLGFVINRLILINMASVKVLHEVISLYLQASHEGDEKPAMKWSFVTKIEANNLTSFLRSLKSSGIDERAKEIGILKSKIKLQYKRLTLEPEFPCGRIFSIDTDEEFQLALPLLQEKHELIGKF